MFDTSDHICLQTKYLTEAFRTV